MRNDNLKRVITEVSTKYGAPMGRANIGRQPVTITSGPNCRIIKKNQTKVFEKRVKLDSGGYDRGGAYWGLGPELRVRFTANLDYVEFFRIK